MKLRTYRSKKGQYERVKAIAKRLGITTSTIIRNAFKAVDEGGDKKVFEILTKQENNDE